MRAHGRIVGFGLLAGILGLACSHQQQVVRQPAAPPVAAAAPAPPPREQPVETPAPEPVQHADDAVYFDFDSSLLREEARPLLRDLAQKLRSGGGARVRIEGNCDERGTTEYNLALGAHRAEAAKKYLQNLGVPRSRIETLSYGSEHPKYEGHDEGAWSKNRRDDFVVR
jgi:peptidoglycan-associated lipoprotein